MNRREALAVTGAAALGAVLSSAGGSLASPDGGTGQSRAIAEAAAAFLAGLGVGQRAAVQLPFAPQPHATAAHFKGGKRGDVDMVGEQYGAAMWSNFPVSDVPRPGLRLGSLDDAQRAAVMALLRVLLSDMGYRKVLDIVGSDQALAEAGQPYDCGRAAYTVAIFGTPGLDRPWMLQFGGHHLALNATLLGGHAVLAPLLTGCLPAIYEEDGRRVRALADENDKAFALLGTLDAAQRRQAMIEHPVSELALGPGRDRSVVRPAGVAGPALDARQRALLNGLALEWAGMLNDVHAAPRLADIRDGMDDTRFAWSGPLTRAPNRNGASYFRVHGPRLFIEFAPQKPGGDLTMHAHTIYRDPAHAYGKGLT